MTTVQCGKIAILDISNVYPGEGESWVAGDPVIFWGDGNQTENVAGTTILHTYSDIGSYDIQLEGRNSCDETCSSSESIVAIENPPNLIVTEISKTAAKVGWKPLAGRDKYHLELYRGTQYIDGWDVLPAYSFLSGLYADTTYTVYVSATVSAYKSEDYCGDNEVSFKTLSDTCEMPSCSFTAE